MGWSECVVWVNANKGIIENHRKRHQYFGPYSSEDFFQEAYITAYNASKIFSLNHASFPSTFWNLYQQVTRESLAPNQKRRIKNESVTDYNKEYRTDWAFEDTGFNKVGVNERKYIVFEEYVEDIHESCAVYCPQDDMFNEPPHDIHRMMIHLSNFLLKNQKEIFITVLGLTGKGALNYTEAAEQLNKRKDEVSKIFSNSCRRLKRLVSEGKIEIDSFPRTLLVSIMGGKTFSPTPAASKTNHSYQYIEETELRMAA